VDAYVNASVSTVDVDTGRSEELVRLPAEEIGQAQLASDLYDDPTVAGREPPSPADPRGIAAVGGLTALAGAAGVVLWRRRVRP
jgi:hypothetical protein